MFGNLIHRIPPILRVSIYFLPFSWGGGGGQFDPPPVVFFTSLKKHWSEAVEIF